jgi:alkylhydroperoxidase family enzyme
MKKTNKTKQLTAYWLITALCITVSSVIQADSAPLLSPVAPEDRTQKQQALMLEMGFENKAPNIFSTLIRNPDLFEAMNPLGLYLLRGSSLPTRDRELIILRVAWLAQSDYEFGHHRIIANKVGMSPVDINRTKKDPTTAGWEVRDRHIVEAVDQLFKQTKMAEKTWMELAKIYDEKQLLDLIITVGQYNSIAMLLNTLKVERDNGVGGFSEGTNN